MGLLRPTRAAVLLVGILSIPSAGYTQVADSLDTSPILIDTTRAPKSNSGLSESRDPLEAGDPRGALWRSALLPGWGQAYNGQVYKTPIIVIALGGMIALAINNNSKFHTFNEAYLYGVFIDEDPHPYPEFEDSYLEYQGVSTSTLRAERDRYQRYRNLSIIGAAAVYGLNLLDAYVNAHLIGFDVGEDLSARVSLGPILAGASLKVRF